MVEIRPACWAQRGHLFLPSTHPTHLPRVSSPLSPLDLSTAGHAVGDVPAGPRGEHLLQGALHSRAAGRWLRMASCKWLSCGCMQKHVAAFLVMQFPHAMWFLPCRPSCPPPSPGVSRWRRACCSCCSPERCADGGDCVGLVGPAEPGAACSRWWGLVADSWGAALELYCAAPYYTHPARFVPATRVLPPRCCHLQVPTKEQVASVTDMLRKRSKLPPHALQVSHVHLQSCMTRSARDPSWGQSWRCS